jgi:hypothetical protein
MRFLRSAACAIAALAILSQVSQVAAAPISSADGISGSAKLASTKAADGFFSMTWAPPGTSATSTATTQFNGSVLGSAIPTFLANYQFSATPIAVSGGTMYNFSSFIAGPKVSLQVAPGQTVDFDLSSMNAVVKTGNENTIIFNGDLTLLGNTSPLDFSPFLSGGKFTITFNVGAGNNINTIIATSGAITGSASFSLQANPAATVPEPASIALFGMMTVAGGLVARRKMRNRTVVEA